MSNAEETKFSTCILSEVDYDKSWFTDRFDICFNIWNSLLVFDKSYARSFCRMKEQLIKELVKTGKDAETLNKQYADKIKHLERVRLH